MKRHATTPASCNSPAIPLDYDMARDGWPEIVVYTDQFEPQEVAGPNYLANLPLVNERLGLPPKK